MSVWQPDAIVDRMPLNATARAWLRVASPHVWQIVIVAGAYFAYMYTRALVFDDVEAIALANAAKIISLEKSLGFFWEPSWQSWAIDGAKALVVVFNWTYIITFWPIIVTAGVILYVKDRPRYIYYRNIVLLSFALALLAFMLFPLAPPRMMTEHSFVDTIKAFGPTFYASREFANYYNPYAAMPSLHFSWTVMFGVLFLTTRNKWIKDMRHHLPHGYPVGNYHNGQSLHHGRHRRSFALMAAAFGVMELGIRRRLFVPQIRERLGARLAGRELPFAVRR